MDANGSPIVVVPQLVGLDPVQAGDLSALEQEVDSRRASSSPLEAAGEYACRNREVRPVGFTVIAPFRVAHKCQFPYP